MRNLTPDDDDTIPIARRVFPLQLPPKRKKFRAKLTIGAAAMLASLASASAVLLNRARPIPIDTETEAQIDSSQPCTIKISHLAPDPAIVVIDFPSLISQGLTLDRVAALAEKAGLPRDRVLGDVELNEAITNCGDTIESYYYGHDYQAADLARFFRLAAAENIPLNAHERWLKSLLKQLGWLTPGAVGAIITLPAAGGPITPEMRAVILHHEISHGAFYTDATYRAYATQFWYSLTEADRAAFTGFLGREGYDTTNTTLMLNETQAYLIFTRDPLFFNANAVGMSQAAIDQLRDGFIANMPDFWLQPMANAPLPIGTKAASCPAGA